MIAYITLTKHTLVTTCILHDLVMVIALWPRYSLWTLDISTMSWGLLYELVSIPQQQCLFWVNVVDKDLIRHIPKKHISLHHGLCWIFHASSFADHSHSDEAGPSNGVGHAFLSLYMKDIRPLTAMCPPDLDLVTTEKYYSVAISSYRKSTYCPRCSCMNDFRNYQFGLQPWWWYL